MCIPMGMYETVHTETCSRTLDRQRLAAVIRRGIRSGLCDPAHMSLEDLVTDADDKLFNLILYSKYHVLHSILPDRSDLKIIILGQGVLTAKSSSITDKDYITRMIFKNIYWCWHIHTFTLTQSSRLHV